MEKKSYSTSVNVRFHHADPAGIVFFGHVYQLAHDAYEDFVVQLGFEWKNWFQNSEWAAPIRHSSCEYLAPMRPGKYEVSVQIEKIGESSFTARYTFQSGANKFCEVSLVHAFMSLSDKKKMAIPSSVRSRLEPYLS